MWPFPVIFFCFVKIVCLFVFVFKIGDVHFYHKLDKNCLFKFLYFAIISGQIRLITQDRSLDFIDDYSDEDDDEPYIECRPEGKYLCCRTMTKGPN